jgi:hypothetical protein
VPFSASNHQIFRRATRMGRRFLARQPKASIARSACRTPGSAGHPTPRSGSRPLFGLTFRGLSDEVIPRGWSVGFTPVVNAEDAGVYYQDALEAEQPILRVPVAGGKIQRMVSLAADPAVGFDGLYAGRLGSRRCAHRGGHSQECGCLCAGFGLAATWRTTSGV